MKQTQKNYTNNSHFVLGITWRNFDLSNSITRNDWKFGGPIIYLDSLKYFHNKHNITRDNKNHCLIVKIIDN